MIEWDVVGGIIGASYGDISGEGDARRVWR